MEVMEVDFPTSFSAHKLNGLPLPDDFSSIVSAGFGNVEFCHFLHTLCAELKVLYDLEEAPSKINAVDDVKAFLYELSAFLTELDCSIDDIRVGSLEDRFNTPQKRLSLVSFLVGELKCARLYAAAELEKSNTSASDKPLTTSICDAMKVLEMSAPQPGVDPIQIIANINVETDRRLQRFSSRPTPIFTSKMEEHKWSTVDQICHQLAADCRARNLLLLKRIDVTVNSFLWSERVRKKEDEIRSLFASRREDMAKVNPPDAARLLAATTDILRVEQASSARLRANTHSRVNPLANAEAPKDRGGRPDEMSRPARETFSTQRGGYRGHGGHGGSRGGSRGGRGGSGGFHNSAENQARTEWQQRTETPHSGGGYRGHQGGDRGHGGWQPRGGRGGGRARGGRGGYQQGY